MGRKLPSSVIPTNTECRSLSEMGKMLRTYRGVAQLRIDQAAKLAGLSTDVLSRIENGQSVTTENLFKLMGLLNLKLSLQLDQEALQTGAQSEPGSAKVLAA